MAILKKKNNKLKNKKKLFFKYKLIKHFNTIITPTKNQKLM